MSQVPSVPEVAEVLALAPRQQPWRHEAPCRNLIRAALCLQGERWGRADRLAFVVVARARLLIHIRAPIGGDSDYDLSSWTDSADCLICDRRFIPRSSRQETCSEACRKRQRHLEERPVQLRRCEHCRDPMDVTQPSQKFCSTRCMKAASYLRTKHEWGRVRDCRTCGGPIPDSLRGDAVYCSEVCRNRANREIPGKVEARREAYRQAADLVVHTACVQCGGPLPEGSNARRLYCSGRCNMAAQRAKARLNGNGHAPQTNGSAAPDRPDPARDAGGDHQDQAGGAAGRARESRLDAAGGAS